MITTLIGIDPGKTGGIATLQILDGKVSLTLGDTPVIKGAKASKDEYDVLAMAQILKRNQNANPHVFIEKVGAMPGQGVTSMFSFGKGFGLWLGMLGALDLPYTLVTPQRWKKTMLSDMTDDKAASRIRAMQLFPFAADSFRLVKDHNKAEAALIAEYGRRIVMGAS